MSNFYTTSGGDGRAANKTRCANHHAWSSVQSWEGSVTVEFEQPAGKDGEIYVSIYVTNQSGQFGSRLLTVPLSMLTGADRLEVISK